MLQYMSTLQGASLFGLVPLSAALTASQLDDSDSEKMTPHGKPSSNGSTPGADNVEVTANSPTVDVELASPPAS